ASSSSASGRRSSSTTCTADNPDSRPSTALEAPICALRRDGTGVSYLLPSMTAPEQRAHGPAGTALALLYVFLWASAFVPSRVLSVPGQPLWVLTVRFAIASVLMAGVVVALRREWPCKARDWLPIAGYGLLANAIYLGCTYEALRHLSS